MAHTPYKKQTNEPLFPDILWNKPITRQASGKLLLIGGHSRQFSLTQSAFMYAQEAGAGEVKAVLPQHLRKLTGDLPDCLFVEATPSGSIAKAAYEQITGFANDSDAVLLPGELSFNEETTSLTESLLTDTEKPIIIGGEIIDMLLHSPMSLLNAAAIIARPDQLSELASKLDIPIYVKKSNLQKELKLLEALGQQLDMPIICYGEHVLVTHKDEVSLTSVSVSNPAKLFAYSAVFYMQHNDKFQALTTAVYQLMNNNPEE